MFIAAARPRKPPLPSLRCGVGSPRRTKTHNRTHWNGTRESIAVNIHAAYYCAAALIRHRQRTGQPIPGWLRRHFAALDTEIRGSRARQETGETGGERSPLNEWIGVREAATIVGWSPRRVQRHAADLGGRLISGRWLFLRSEVTANAGGRND